MKKEEFFQVLGDIDDNIIESANKTTNQKVNMEANMKTSKKTNFKILGAAVACVCVMIIGAFGANRLLPTGTQAPDPEQCQIANPLIDVASVEEMEKMLDYSIPVLGKEVDVYTVIIDDESYPRQARISYKDGSEFDMKYGSEDVSGIYGGQLDREATIENVKVSFYNYDDGAGTIINYAIWEKDGFSYSYSGSDDLESAISELIK